MTAAPGGTLAAALTEVGVLHVTPSDALAAALTGERPALILWSVPAPASAELVACSAARWACAGEPGRVTLAQPESAWTVDAFDVAVASRLSVSAPEPVHLVVGSTATISARMFDRLLVTLESPPAPIVVHLATDGATRVPVTVRSRATVTAAVTPAPCTPATAAAAGVPWPLLRVCAGRVDLAAALTAVGAAQPWVDMWERCAGSWDAAQAEQMVQMVLCAAAGTPYTGGGAPPGPTVRGAARMRAQALVTGVADALLCAAADQVRQCPDHTDASAVTAAVRDAQDHAAVNLGPDLVMHVMLAQLAAEPVCPLCAASHRGPGHGQSSG